MSNKPGDHICLQCKEQNKKQILKGGDYKMYLYLCDFIKRDMENAFNVLDSNGIMWMDDYRYGHDGMIKKTMDEFLNKYTNQYVLIHMGYQLAIKKL